MNDNCFLIDECESVPLDKFRPEVLFSCQGLPTDAADQYIMNAAIDFMTRSKVFRQMLCLDLQACVSDLILEANCGMQIVSIHKVCDRELLPNQPCAIPGCDGASAWFVPPHSLTISPEPKRDIPNALMVLVSVAPHPDACELPAELYRRNDWRKAVINGALAELMEVPGTEFYNPQLAEAKRRRYEAGITVGSMDRLLGFGQGPIKMHSKGRFV